MRHSEEPWREECLGLVGEGAPASRRDRLSRQVCRHRRTWSVGDRVVHRSHAGVDQSQRTAACARSGCRVQGSRRRWRHAAGPASASATASAWAVPAPWCATADDRTVRATRTAPTGDSDRWHRVHRVPGQAPASCTTREAPALLPRTGGHTGHTGCAFPPIRTLTVGPGVPPDPPCTHGSRLLPPVRSFTDPGNEHLHRVTRDVKGTVMDTSGDRGSNRGGPQRIDRRRGSSVPYTAPPATNTSAPASAQISMVRGRRHRRPGATQPVTDELDVPGGSWEPPRPEISDPESRLHRRDQQHVELRAADPRTARPEWRDAGQDRLFARARAGHGPV